MTGNMDLYEELKDLIGEAAALAIARRFPSTEVATKADLDAGFARLEARLTRLMMTFFLPTWLTMLAMFGTLIAVAPRV